MKRTILLVLVAAVFATMQAAVKVDRIEPTDWYVGLNAVPSVQLMVYGQGIRDAEVTIDYPGVRLDSVVRLDSPNYLLLYVDTRQAQPGVMELKFKQGKQKKAVKYTLKAREKSGSERYGFTNADVLYMLMPDRFADGNPANNVVPGMRSQICDRTHPSVRHGGDLEGIRQHLGYLNELGVTALWFTPVLENDSPKDIFNDTYHGYATTNYYRVDPRFGTNEEYRCLVDEAHAKGLKVVMDMIFNHCGFEHPWVADMPSKDWFNLHEWLKESKGTSDSRGTSFQQTSYRLAPVLDPYASDVDKKETVQGWFVSTMPDLNQNNVHVMNYLIQNSIWWIETVGIDGIRMDTYPYAYDEPMARWMRVIDQEYPNFNVVGETWFETPAYTAAWQRD
ncbi:MAG: cyclomaltodextrinase N-terminal domain-containing protein, partial [Muribaculaceae bacterium]|nr:cyclomaltodextrinase N-terminal domain-containing protein [Muribaculaceae bacterium]